jgi:ankyrin repeat protein/L-ascorbate metabolism protein UlaG (beta-lactamase superfamily)
MNAALMLLIVTTCFPMWQQIPAQEIHEAIRKGDAAVIGAILKDHPECIHSRSDRNATPLHIACETGRKEIVALLMASGADLKIRDGNGDMPIHYAARAGSVEIVKLFLEKGIDVDIADDHGRTALHRAAEGGHAPLVAFLLDQGAALNAPDQWGFRALHQASLRGGLEVFNLLVTRGADVSAVSGEKTTPVHWAAQGGQAGIIGRMIDLGMNLNQTDGFGMLPISWAALMNQQAVVETMITRAKGLRLMDDLKRTPLHFASFRSPTALLQFLLSRGFDANAADVEGRTPLHWACWGGQKNNADLLIARGSKVNAVDTAGQTPLHLAAAKGNLELIQELLDKGASSNAKDKQGWTPGDLARSYGRSQAADLLTGRVGKDEARRAAVAAGNAFRETLQSGEARIWYLGHCGWAVKTKNHLLIFDYMAKAPAQARAIANGFIDPSQWRDENVFVFTSHSHRDHFSPEIFRWQEQIPHITYVFGWQAEDNPKYNYLNGPKTERTIAGVEIATINSYHSDVPEVAYLVKVDGLVIYHSGDYVGKMDEYRQDIDGLAKKFGPADIAFLFLSGEVPLYSLERLAPKLAFPMHSFGMEPLYQGCARTFSLRSPKSEIRYPEKEGDQFQYPPRRLR